MIIKTSKFRFVIASAIAVASAPALKSAPQGTRR